MTFRIFGGVLPTPWNQGRSRSCAAHTLALALTCAARRRGEVFEASRRFIDYLARRVAGGVGHDPEHGRPVGIPTALAALAARGVCAEADWPWDGSCLDARPPAAAYAAAACRRVAFRRIRPELPRLLRWLARDYPVVFGIHVFGGFPGRSTAGRPDVPVPRGGEARLGSHALLAIGYDRTRRVFIARGSFGPSWGDAGDCFLPFDYLTDPRLAFDHFVVDVGPATVAPPSPQRESDHERHHSRARARDPRTALALQS